MDWVVRGGGDIFDDISFWGRSGERWEGARLLFLSGRGGGGKGGGVSREENWTLFGVFGLLEYLDYLEKTKDRF